MPEVSWDIMLKTIEDESCILIVGPEVYTDYSGKSVEKQINERLALPQNQNIRAYQDGLYYFKEPIQKTKFCYDLEKFYSEAKFERARNIFTKLSKIPFYFSINLTPDQLMYKTFKFWDDNVQSGFYWKNHPPNIQSRPPSQSYPLVYNILGSIEKHESLVLSNNDLFDYFESVFQAKSMDNNLKNNIKNAKNLIFLGVRFDRWYMQLILRVLYMHTSQSLLKYASNIEIKEDIVDLAYDHFRISVIPFGIEEFVDKIYEKCAENDMLKTKREASNDQNQDNTRYGKIVSYIKEDETEGAMQEIEEWIETLIPDDEVSAIEMEIIHLQARYKRNEKKRRNGSISNSEYDIERNSITTTLLEIVTKIKSK